MRVWRSCSCVVRRVENDVLKDVSVCGVARVGKGISETVVHDLRALHRMMGSALGGTKGLELRGALWGHKNHERNCAKSTTAASGSRCGSHVRMTLVRKTRRSGVVEHFMFAAEGGSVVRGILFQGRRLSRETCRICASPTWGSIKTANDSTVPCLSSRRWWHCSFFLDFSVFSCSLEMSSF